MRILVAAHNYPRFPGDPAGAYVRSLALAFQARGHATAVVAPHTAGAAGEETEQGVAVRRFRYAPESLQRIGYRGEPRLARLLLAPAALALPAYLLAFRAAIRRAVRRLRPDLIHAHWWIPAGWLAVGTGLPTVITSHGTDVRLLERGGWIARTARGVSGRARAWTAVSRFLATDLEARLALQAGTVPVTPMPVDVARFAQGSSTPKAHPPRILFAGNLVATKGVDVLIAAVGRLRDRGVACTLLVHGEGPARESLAAQVRLLGLKGVVTLAAFVPHSEMPAVYGGSTVTVLPSRGQAEGLGLTLVEALLAGSAVIGTPAGGIPEVIEHGVTGLLVPDGDPDALADQLALLLSDAALRERLTAAGGVKVRGAFGTEAAAARFLDLFDAVLQRHA